MLKVFSKPRCVQCEQSVRLLEREGIPFEYIDVTKSQEDYATAEAYGIKSMPIVVPLEGEPWGGFNPDRIKAQKAH